MTRSQGKPMMGEVVEGEFDEETGELLETGLALHHSGGSGGMQQVKTTAYSTAMTVARPRALKIVQKNVLEEASLAGEEFFYAWSQEDRKRGAKSMIEGISIDGAMILARNWGNCATPVSLESETPSHWVFRAAFIDLETGYNSERLFRQRKAATQGKYEAERKLDIAFQIGQSKAIRNVVVKSMPTWLTTAALERAKTSAEGKYRDVKAEAPKFVKTFQKEFGVGPELLIRKIGLPIDQWTPRDLMTLAAIGRAIRDRQTTVAQEFDVNEQPPAPQQAAAPPEPNTPAAPELDQMMRQPGDDGDEPDV